MIPDDDEAEHVEDDAANLEAVLEPEEGEEGEAGGEEGEAADVEAPAAEEGEGDAAEGAEDADGNLLFLGIKLVKDINCRICNFCFQAELMVATVVTVATVAMVATVTTKWRVEAECRETTGRSCRGGWTPWRTGNKIQTALFYLIRQQLGLSEHRRPGWMRLLEQDRRGRHDSGSSVQFLDAK